jgi:hypothetical protein
VVLMFNWLKMSREAVVSFCDRCAKVCDAGCRQAAIREQARLRALRFGVRF